MIPVVAFVAELVFELLFSIVGVVVGWGVAELLYSLWVGLRWSLRSAGRPGATADPTDRLWYSRVTWRPWPAEWPLSRRALGLHGKSPRDQQRTRDQSHLLHPVNLIDRFDDALILILPLVTVAIAIILAVFVVETIVAVVLAAAFGTWRLVARRSWRVVITDPDGVDSWIYSLSAGEAKVVEEEIALSISRGEPVAPLIAAARAELSD